MKKRKTTRRISHFYKKSVMPMGTTTVTATTTMAMMATCFYP